MGKHSKWFIVLAAIAVVMAVGITAYAASLNPPTETVDQYLVDAGYPADIVDGLADEVKLRFYNGGYTYESSVTSYGIVTDNYNIAFDIDDNGEVVIDAENLNELEQLQNDNFAVIKILYDKQKAIAVKNENAVDYSSVQNASVQNPSAQSSVISAAAWRRFAGWRSVSLRRITLK